MLLPNLASIYAGDFVGVDLNSDHLIEVVHGHLPDNVGLFWESESILGLVAIGGRGGQEGSPAVAGPNFTG